MKSISLKTCRYIVPFILAWPASGCMGLTQQSYFMDSAESLIKSESTGESLYYSLPKSLVSIQITRKSNVVTIGAPVPLVTADPAARFGVRINENAFAYDKYKIEINTAGLLSSAKSDNFDKTPEIINKAVELFAESAKISVFRNALSLEKVATAPDITEDFVIDPFQSRQKVSKTGAEINFFNLDGSPLPRISSQQISEAARQCNRSLCSRLLRPVIVKITFGKAIYREHLIMVPDPTFVVSHDITRSACIQRVTTIAFSAGVLTTFEVDKPSEILGCIDIPLDVVKKIVAIPGEALTLRVNQTESRNKLTNLDIAALEAKVRLLDAQSKLREKIAAE